MKQISVRLCDEVEKECDELKDLYNVSYSVLCENLIRQEYHKIKCDPKMKKGLETINMLKATFENLEKELDKAGYKK